MARKACKPGLIAALVVLLATYLPSTAAAQETDWITKFPRDPVHVAAWPSGKKVAVALLCSSRSSASARVRSSARTWRTATRTS